MELGNAEEEDMDLCHESCLTLTLDITSKLFNQILSYLPCLYAPFYTAFTDLGMGSQGQRKAKPLGFIFLYIFQLMMMKSDVALKQLIKVEQCNTIFEWDLIE